MIGPLNSYQDIYVAECGQQFVNGKQGRLHERDCQECQAVPDGDVSERAVYLATIGGKQSPVLVCPDGSRIHLMPHVIPGGQDPVKVLRQWLDAWIEASEPGGE